MNNNVMMGLAIGVGLSATVLASAYMFNGRGETTANEPEKTVKVAAKERECWNETIVVNRQTKDNTTAGTLIGGAIGGLAGSQVGEGKGNQAATAAGAVAGAMIGRNQGKPSTTQETQVVRRCR